MGILWNNYLAQVSLKFPRIIRTSFLSNISSCSVISSLKPENGWIAVSILILLRHINWIKQSNNVMIFKFEFSWLTLRFHDAKIVIHQIWNKVVMGLKIRIVQSLSDLLPLSFHYFTNGIISYNKDFNISNFKIICSHYLNLLSNAFIVHNGKKFYEWQIWGNGCLH